MTKKMCEICGDEPATVPDRERMGRPINRVCNSCHALRLAGDLKRIMELEEKHRRELLEVPLILGGLIRIPLWWNLGLQFMQTRSRRIVLVENPSIPRW